MPGTVPTFAELTVDRLVFLLVQYRDFVEKHADGLPLTDEEEQAVGRMLRGLELPTFCFRRDVVATRRMSAATTDHRRRELAWMHPHLWTDAEQWAETRLAARGRRRYLLEQLRRARGFYDSASSDRGGRSWLR